MDYEGIVKKKEKQRKKSTMQSFLFCIVLGFNFVSSIIWHLIEDKMNYHATR
ncbi:Uncharacterised protein [Providencia alcalifaciens]|nr:Uncharacterised protein [Providencia alcalifaciens]